MSSMVLLQLMNRSKFSLTCTSEYSKSWYVILLQYCKARLQRPVQPEVQLVMHIMLCHFAFIQEIVLPVGLQS